MKNPAMRYGLIFGVILAVLGVANSVRSLVTGAYANAGSGTVDAAGTLIGLALLVIGIVLYLLAGRSAAAQTGRVGTGAVAGLIAGLVSSVVGAIVLIAIVLGAPVPSIPASATGTLTQDQFATIYRGAAIGGAIVSIAFAAGIGAGLGALGGLMGKSAYEKTHPPMPMGMPGAYPPPPGFPNQPMQ